MAFSEFTAGEYADSKFIYKRTESLDELPDMLVKAKENPVVLEYIEGIKALREEVALKMGLKSEMDEVTTLRQRISDIIKSRGLRSGKENYIQTLSQGLALFAMAFYGKDIVYRTTDFKTNEYHNLLGGLLFEHHEDNPMLGYRGVSRNIHDWELEAFKLARGVFGGKNLHIMFALRAYYRRSSQHETFTSLRYITLNPALMVLS